MARAAFRDGNVGCATLACPEKAFVPMLSAHACAIPGIMATRTIENWRDRLVTILVLPLLTCSARTARLRDDVGFAFRRPSFVCGPDVCVRLHAWVGGGAGVRVLLEEDHTSWRGGPADHRIAALPNSKLAKTPSCQRQTGLPRF